MRPRALVLAVAAVALAIAVAACPPAGRQRPFAPSPPPSQGWEHHEEVVKLPDGAHCTQANECASGTCEGEGCGATAGICASTHRACTKDLRDYCGCDGVAFQASGSCPGQRYLHAGACKHHDGDGCQTGAECESGVCEGQGCDARSPGVCVGADRICAAVVTEFCGCDGQPFSSASSCAGRRYASIGACRTAAPQADGASCRAAGECASGVCEGQGCGRDAPGVCVAKHRTCTKDRRPYCGCDGATFFSSGTCPGQRYQAKGSCAAP